MKGIILAGGSGTRLAPLTHVVNKHMLPIFDRQMILYPIETLRRNGITDVMLITGGEHVGRFIEFLGDGSRFGVQLTYRVQDKPGGLAQAVGLCESFSDGEEVAVILGDNIFAHDFMVKKSSYGCTIFVKEVEKIWAQRLGCVIVEGDKVVLFEEKPQEPKSLLIATGFYIFSSEVFDIIRALKPSARGELEIGGVIDAYIQRGDCGYAQVSGEWYDAGTLESLVEVSQRMYQKSLEA